MLQRKHLPESPFSQIGGRRNERLAFIVIEPIVHGLTTALAAVDLIAESDAAIDIGDRFLVSFDLTPVRTQIFNAEFGSASWGELDTGGFLLIAVIHATQLRWHAELVHGGGGGIAAETRRDRIPFDATHVAASGYQSGRAECHRREEGQDEDSS